MAPSFLDSVRAQPIWILLLSTTGILSLIKLSISLLYWSYAFFLRPAKDLKSHYGSWALVTGSTDGIGKALAFELAHKNLNLVLVGRSPDKLKDVSAAIKEKFTEVRIKNVVIDLARDLKDGIRRLGEAIEGLDVGVLVNNAGVSTPNAMFFHEAEMELWREIIKVNLEALTEVTKAVLPGMLDRGRGAIVNIGSGSTVAVPSYPLFAIYAATKAYVDQFSRSLHVEYKNRGIDVQCQIPMYVDTKMISQFERVHWYSFFVASANAYARAAVRWIGYEPQCVPYLPHFLQCCFASLVPDFIHNHVRLRTNLNRRKPYKLL